MKIPLEQIAVVPSHDPAAGRDKQAILIVEGGNLAGYTLGFVPPGQAARKEYQGPLVDGPWAYGFANATVMDNFGGTAAILFRAEQQGRLFRTKFGDTIEIDGRQFRVERNGPDQIKLQAA